MGTSPGTKRGALNREVIARAGITIVERDGLSGLTLVALGHELGVHPTAIYRHVSGKDDVVRDIVHLVESELLEAFPEPLEDWRDDLRACALTAAEVLLRYPSLAPITTVRFTGELAEFAIAERIFLNLERAGFSDEEAPGMFRAFVDALYGMIGGQAAFLALPSEQRISDEVVWSKAFASLDPVAFPHTSSAAEHAVPLEQGEGLGLAVDLLLEAMAARIAARGTSTN